MDSDRILAACGPEGDPAEAVVIADYFLERGDPRMAAAALDRAYGLAPDDPAIAAQRAAILDDLEVREHGLIFRYVPAGTLLMGSPSGDPDERPVHGVRTGDFWIADIPMTWAAFCHLMEWQPPPRGRPAKEFLEKLDRMAGFHLYEGNKIRLQYCETDTVEAGDWHAHDPAMKLTRGAGEPVDPASIFGRPNRSHPDRPYRYDTKPMVAVSWDDAEILAERISTEEIRYALPSEAQWEKAARGGLIAARYSWGDEPPTPQRCDFDHFGAFVLRDPRSLPANGYGVHGMCGGVWEWTGDVYDALAYARRGDPDFAEPPGAAGAAGDDDKSEHRTLRGGSFSDCSESVTVSFRMSRAGGSWQEGQWSDCHAPNIGFRLCRVERNKTG